MASERSIVVIGGGIAGLTAGGMLAKEGWRVVLLEANSKLGGCSANTHIDGYTFHDGAVFLVMRSVLEHVFGRLGLDFHALLPLRRIVANSTTYLPDGSIVTHADGCQVSVQGPRPFNAEQTRRELQSLVDTWRPIYRALTTDLLIRQPSVRRMLAQTWRHLPRMLRSAAAELRRSITDPAVRSALAGSILYSGVPAEKSPAMGLLGLIAAMEEGTWLPEGGMGRIPTALGAAMQRFGGEVILGSPVERIVIEGGRVRGVEVFGRGKIACDNVLSTVGGMATLGRLVAPDCLPRALQRKLRNAVMSHRAVSIQLGLRNHLKVPSYAINVLPNMDEQKLYFNSGEHKVSWLSWTVPTSVVPDLAPAGGSIIELFPPIRQDLAPTAWDEERRSMIRDATLEALARHYSLDVAVSRVRGPGEFEREMHLMDGAIYGLSPATNPLAMFPHRTPIKGLYLAGQTTFPGFGVPTTAAGGILAAESIQRDAH